ncbi:hypothetical protein F4777DRAFT_244123 [Nemania sp. FL0916]|nr:hypothetical protein F4777DRAFT_244123 [Nemania sp. FL0916]
MPLYFCFLGLKYVLIFLVQVFTSWPIHLVISFFYIFPFMMEAARASMLLMCMPHHAQPIELLDRILEFFAWSGSLRWIVNRPEDRVMDVILLCFRFTYTMASVYASTTTGPLNWRLCSTEFGIIVAVYGIQRIKGNYSILKCMRLVTLAFVFRFIMMVSPKVP